MAKIYTFLADGFEEIEALTPIDLLRRADNEVVTVSIMGRRLVHASHGVNIEADTLFEEAGDFADGELFILPGGGVGTQNLGSCEPLLALIKEKYAAGVRVAAICAAPSIFGKLGFLKGRKAIVYPGTARIPSIRPPHALLLQLTRPRRPYGTRKGLLSAAAFLP